jgi:hypothetical protein
MMSSSIARDEHSISHFEGIPVPAHHEATVHQDPVGVLFVHFGMYADEGGLSEHGRWDADRVDDCG